MDCERDKVDWFYPIFFPNFSFFFLCQVPPESEPAQSPYQLATSPKASIISEDFKPQF